MTIKKLYTPAEVIEARQRLFGLSTDQLISRGFINIQEVLRENATYSLVLETPGEKKIQAIKVVRQLTLLGLGESKALADTAPSVILTGATEQEATDGARELRSIGAVASVVREVAS
jgi:large subunit ribosomal protein L7/L12